MIHIIIGTKAQLIKMAPVLKTLTLNNIEYNYITTGQHKETIEDILANFSLKKPDYVLYAGKDITSIFQMAIWFITSLFKTLKHRQQIFQGDTQGIVLVHGDTFSTLLGALMGKIGKLKVAHVESGLRSFNLFHPFPEEITRILTFKLADYLFCPNDTAINNLTAFRGNKINTRINTLYDALKFSLPAIENQTVEIPNKDYGIVTLHRFENIYRYQALKRVVSIVERISQKQYLLFILHKPTEIKLRQFGFFERLANNPQITFRPRYSYFEFMKLIRQAQFVVSDGGSNQEECFYLGKPILLLRKATERFEGLNKNCVLSHYDLSVVDEFIDNVDKYRFDFQHFPYSPSQIIVESCKSFVYG
jgi:UDP-N-acetylglucosamine 2-epimerase (non-hydrolysing)